jgi:hypothetical protein
MDAPEDRKAAVPPAEEYDAEVLCASWNPVASAVAEPRAHATPEGARAPAGDPDSFLSQFYRLQGS